MVASSEAKPALWHCHNARSLRPLWALEEMEIDYDLHILPFPPRVFAKGFLDINVLGTVPYFEDHATKMTESTAICHYLAKRYKKHEFVIDVSESEYGAFLNWLFHSDATLTFPQTLYLRYLKMEPEERRQPQVAEDYRRWFLARLRLLDAHIENREYLCANRFTIADIAVGYALFLGRTLSLDSDYKPATTAYLDRLVTRPAFQRAVTATADS